MAIERADGNAACKSDEIIIWMVYSILAQGYIGLLKLTSKVDEG